MGIEVGHSPPPYPAIEGSKESRSTGMGEERGGLFLKIRIPRPEFPSSSSAETPMSCEQPWQMVGEG